jgi:hypothetical protein
LVDILYRRPDSQQARERRRVRVSAKSAAQRWGENRERHLMQHGPTRFNKEVPTLEQFAPRFIEAYARANRQKPSTVGAKEMILRVHLGPALGKRRLDTITNEDVQQLKHRLIDKAPKTVNNVLTVLNVLLKKAVEWDVIERVPCTIKLLRVPKGSIPFYDFEEFERLVAAARLTDPRAYLLVLLLVRRDSGWARWWPSNGATSTCRRTRCACSAQRGRAKSHRRKAGGCGMCRSRRGWLRHCESTVTCEAGWCFINTTARQR